jgi:mono/diheme cytochrome c family protein
MKLKIIATAIVALLIYSCAAKSSVRVVEAKKEELSKEPVVESKYVVMTEALAEGKTLFENNCAKCHGLYNPKDFSAEQWKLILIRMQSQAHLEDAQIATISDYINSQL